MRRDPVYTDLARELRRNTNDAEQKLWSCLRGRLLGGYKFRRQYPIGKYIADFACIPARLVIEVDGDTHGTDESEARDAKRTDDINKFGYRVIRFSNDDVYHEIDGVLEAILIELDPSP